MTLSLYNSKHFLGTELTDIKDVRAIVRRADPQTHDATVPLSPHDFFEASINAFIDGEVHFPSKYPLFGQRDRMRIKEFGTVENVDAPANADQRRILADAYFNQILNVVILQGLEKVDGNESQLFPYLKNKFGYLFHVIPTMEGHDSSLNIDRAFNKNGFHSNVYGVPMDDWVYMLRSMVRQVGRNVPGMRIQAKVVDHILERATTEAPEGNNLAKYFGTNGEEYQPNGHDVGIVTDYKRGMPISDMLSVQASGLVKQAKALNEIRDDNDVLDFFGIGRRGKKAVDIYIAP